MELLNDALNFISRLSLFEIIVTFWYFFFVDSLRYIVINGIGLIKYFIDSYRLKDRKVLARQQLFMESPLVSVLVPGKNEGKNLYKLARSLKKQSYKNLELIVVDDGSNDDTPTIARHLLKRGLITNFFRNEQRGGKASAANLALRFCKGKFVVHLDADTLARNDALEKMLIHFYLDDNIAAVGGDVRVNNLQASVCASLQSLEYIKTITTARTIASAFGILRIISGAFGAFRTDALNRVKGWDVGPGLDGDITIRFRKLGYKVVHEPNAICYTNVPVKFTKLAKQRFRWDRSLVRFRLRRHRDLLNIFNRNFSFLNFITIMENVVFNFAMNIKWWVYFFYIVVFHTDSLHIILLVNYVLYLISNVLQYIYALLILGDTIKKEELQISLLLVLMPLYSTFLMRPVRTYAHMMELIHKVSYFDAWNPWKVSQKQLYSKKNTQKNMIFGQKRD
ncbi:MAG: glycosyltransferase [Colwellia sp.]|nr:glycosyltransferase [Colwellia sp.]